MVIGTPGFAESRVLPGWSTEVVAGERALTDCARPRDVVQAAGRWLDEAMAPSGFGWLPRPLKLERRAGTLVQQIHVQPSRGNRAGKLVVAGPADELVCGHLLGYASGRANGYLYGDAENGDIDLTDPGQRRKRLAAFVAVLSEAVMPWFDEAADRERIVASRPVRRTPTVLVLLPPEGDQVRASLG